MTTMSRFVAILLTLFLSVCDQTKNQEQFILQNYALIQLLNLNQQNLTFPEPGERKTPPTIRETYSTKDGTLSTTLVSGAYQVEKPVEFSVNTPSAIVYAEQLQTVTESTTSTEIIKFHWKLPASETPYANYRDSGTYTFGGQLLPLAQNVSLLGGIGYPSYSDPETKIYRTLVSFPKDTSAKNPDDTFANASELHIIRSATKLSDSEQTFSVNSGAGNTFVGHWTDYRHLNVNIILVQGATGHKPTLAELQPAKDMMSAIFAQDTVKIKVHYTETIVVDDNLLDITILDEASKENQQKNCGTPPDNLEYCPGTYTHLFENTTDSQAENAINVFILRTREILADFGGQLPAAGNSTCIPVQGTRTSGAIVYIRDQNTNTLDEMEWRMVGWIMAHEVGHGLGLYHSFQPTASDPLEGTSCNNSTDCRKNVMYFSVPDPTDLMFYVPTVTDEQAYVMRLHPLSYF